jgi:K+-transporting ATPase ATPase C chain
MNDTLITSLRVAAVTIVLTGVAYPLVVYGVAQTLLPTKAEGSLIRADDGTVVGSELWAQPFSQPAYVWPRPSAPNYCLKPESGEACSAGSNYGPTSKALRDRVTAEAERLRKTNPDAKGDVPAELVTASASGLDPHLSPASVEWQVARVAAARGIDAARVRAVVAEYAQGRELGFLGEPRVNVLELNLALDRRFGKPPGGANIPPK